MSRMMEAWRRRTGPQRFETYTRWTLYILLAAVPLLALAVIPVDPLPPAAPVYFLVMLALTGQAIVVIRDGVGAFQDGRPVRRGLVVALLVLTAVAVLAALLTLPPSDDVGWLGRGAAVALALGVGLCALTPVLGSHVLVPAALVAGVLAALTQRPALEWGQLATTAFVFALVLVAIVPSFRISIWMLGVVWEQERTRQLHARLAVAEERLRFSRDLHDVMGRALSAVALKSELAAELARRDQGEAAAAQMLEVRELANDSLKEVRAVVAGYRQADLAAEVAGARSVLRSAGVRTRVIGEDAVLPLRVQSALAWVVREGVTNVVRHSSASSCTIDLAVLDDDGGRVAQLTITNDGAAAAPSTGSGLVGLSERLAALGGTVSSEFRDGTFTLRARVPLGADAALPPDDGARPTDDGARPADDGTRPADDGARPADDGTRPSDDAALPRGAGSRSSGGTMGQP